MIYEESYVIQYQGLQWDDWYDYRVTTRLDIAREILEDEVFVKLRELGTKYRIVKRTTYEEVMGT